MSRERIIIVDEGNKVLGAKFRYEVDHTVDIHRSTAVWITDSKGNVLLAQRALHKSGDPGKWGPAAAGTVEEGESYEDNAYKVLAEEIGLVNVKLRPDKVYLYDGKVKQFSKRYFGTADVRLEDLVLQESEVAAVKWMPIEELTKDIESNPSKYVESMGARLKTVEFM